MALYDPARPNTIKNAAFKLLPNGGAGKSVADSIIARFHATISSDPNERRALQRAWELIAWLMYMTEDAVAVRDATRFHQKLVTRFRTRNRARLKNAYRK